MSFKRKKIKPSKRLLMSGITVCELREKKRSIKENFFNCLWNALIIFLFLYGIFGFFITSFSLPCNMLALTAFMAFISVFFSMFYLRRLFFNLGYLSVLIFIIYYSFTHYREVNSGYSAILNLIIVAIDDELNLANLREFTEYFLNRTVAITSCLIVIITVVACLFNMWVSRRNSIFYPLFIIILPVLEVSIYLTDEFSYLYLLVILAALTLFIFTKQNDENPLDNKPKLETYKEKRNRIAIKSRIVENKGNILGVLSFVLITLFISILSFLFLPSTYAEKNSSLKDKTDKVVSEVAMHGFSALFNSNMSGTAGMNNGTFGDIKSVSLDYETDLEITFVPNTFAPVYIPTYYANKYDSKARRWVLSEDAENDTLNTAIGSTSEHALTKEFLEKLRTDESYALTEEAKTASAYMMIKNVAAGEHFPAYLYYDGNDSEASRNEINENTSLLMPYTASMYDYDELPDIYEFEWAYPNRKLDTKVYMNYLDVPLRISSELDEICFREGFHGTETEIINQIIDFLAENYEYTLQPGATPEDEDFVLYFLNEEKKGFCVHFASAACLLLRSMGIPAKYVEGYSFDYTVYDDAVLFDSDSYSEEEVYGHDRSGIQRRMDLITLGNTKWYDGYNELGFEKPVSFDLTDANAHAWVEVYFKGFGWVPIEFTVGSMSEDGNLASVLSMLDSLSSSSDNEDGNGLIGNSTITQMAEAAGAFINYGLKNIVLIVFILAVFMLLARKLQLSYRIYYAKEDRRAINQYRFIADAVRNDLIKRNKADRDYYESIILSNSALSGLLQDKYNVNSALAANYRDVYEEFNYSGERKVNEIKALTELFSEISAQVAGSFGFFKKSLYRFYLFRLFKR